MTLKRVYTDCWFNQDNAVFYLPVYNATGDENDESGDGEGEDGENEDDDDDKDGEVEETEDDKKNVTVNEPKETAGFFSRIFG